MHTVTRSAQFVRIDTAEKRDKVVNCANIFAFLGKIRKRASSSASSASSVQFNPYRKRGKRDNGSLEKALESITRMEERAIQLEHERMEKEAERDAQRDQQFMQMIQQTTAESNAILRGLVEALRQPAPYYPQPTMAPTLYQMAPMNPQNAAWPSTDIGGDSQHKSL